VSAETLTFAALVGLPLVAAVCLGLLVRAILSGGRSWLLWFIAVVTSCVVWSATFAEAT
jgi:hypothetical protein